MCGRYFINNETLQEVERLAQGYKEYFEIDKKKDIYPSNVAPVIIQEKNQLSQHLLYWGFPKHFEKGIVINARSEGIWEKKMFRLAMETKRVIIPASGFYEWDSKKNKYTFTRENQRTLYFAGCSIEEQNKSYFVIITTEANSSVKTIHSRMPLLLEQNQIEGWLNKRQEAEKILRQVPCLLNYQIDPK